MTEILDVFKLLLKRRFGFKFIYSSSYWMLNAGKHIFPIVKYRMIYERLLELGARRESFLLPRPATDEDVLRVHTAKYLRKLKTATLSTLEIQALEIPFSPELVRFAETTRFNSLELSPEGGGLGVIASGIAYNYVLENLRLRLPKGQTLPSISARDRLPSRADHP